jgi:hypothetical protein
MKAKGKGNEGMGIQTSSVVTCAMTRQEDEEDEEGSDAFTRYIVDPEVVIMMVAVEVSLRV